MNAHRVDNLTRKQEAAITALLTETTIERAAKAAGVATRTLYNWLEQPGFSRAFRRARRQAFNQATSLALSGPREPLMRRGTATNSPTSNR